MVPISSKPIPHGLLSVSALAASHSFQLFVDTEEVGTHGRRKVIDSTTRSPRFAGATLLITRTVIIRVSRLPVSVKNCQEHVRLCVSALQRCPAGPTLFLGTLQL